MVSIRWHFVPNPVSFSKPRFAAKCKTSSVFHTRYDAFNHLVRRSLDSDANGTPNEVAKYVYDGDDLALEFDGADALTHRYLWNSAVDEVLADEQIGAQVLWPLADHEGTVRDLANSTGAVVNHREYDSFGQLTAETNPAVDHLFAYTGQLRDEATGLQNHLNRWYDPAVGRWTSEDPLGFGGGDANLYRYVGNNPVILVDPSGLCGTESSSPGYDDTPSPGYDTPSSDHYMPPWWPGPAGTAPLDPGWPSSNSSLPPVPSPVRPLSPADVARGQTGGGTTGAPNEVDSNEAIPSAPAESPGFLETYWDELSRNYASGVGSTAKGYFWNGPKGMLSGLYNTVRHPWDTAVGIGTALRHPIDTAKAIKDDVVRKSQTSEGQGELAFDVSTTLTPAGLAAKAKLAERIAKGAKAAKAASNSPFSKLSSLGAAANRNYNKLVKLANQAAAATGKQAATRLEQLARKAGLNVVPGGKHLKVMDPTTGNLVTTIPHSPHAKPTIEAIARDILDAANL